MAAGNCKHGLAFFYMAPALMSLLPDDDLQQY